MDWEVADVSLGHSSTRPRHPRRTRSDGRCRGHRPGRDGCDRQLVGLGRSSNRRRPCLGPGCQPAPHQVLQSPRRISSGVASTNPCPDLNGDRSGGSGGSRGFRNSRGPGHCGKVRSRTELRPGGCTDDSRNSRPDDKGHRPGRDPQGAASTGAHPDGCPAAPTEARPYTDVTVQGVTTRDDLTRTYGHQSRSGSNPVG